MEDIESILKKIVEKLKLRPEVLAVYLFGSHAKGYAREDSDIDIGVMLDRDKEPSLSRMLANGQDLGPDFYGLQFDLENLLRPIISNMEISVLLMNNASAPLKRTIIMGQRLYAKDELRATLEEQKIMDYYDEIKGYLDYTLKYSFASARRNLGIL